MAVGKALYAFIVLGIASVCSILQQHISNSSIGITDRMKVCCRLVYLDDDDGSNFNGDYYSSIFAQINDTVYSNYVEHIESQRREVNGPQLNVLLVTRSTENIYPYSVYSYLLQLIYSRVNDYILAPVNSADFHSTDDYEYYPKLSILLHHIQREDVYTDYIVWIDAGVSQSSRRIYY